MRFVKSAVLLVLVVGSALLTYSGGKGEKNHVSLTDKNSLQYKMASARVGISYELKDPSSAKFRSTWLASSNVVCGYVNGRNSYGAYSGFQMFVYFLDSDQGLIGRNPDLATEKYFKQCD